MKSHVDRVRDVCDLLERKGIGHLTERVLKVLDSAPKDGYYDHVAALVAERERLVEETGRRLERIMAIDAELRDMEATMRRVLAVLDAAERDRRAGE